MASHDDIHNPPGTISRAEFTARAYHLMRLFQPLTYEGASLFRWFDGRGRMQRERIAITPFELPVDPKDAAIVLAMLTHFRPGEYQPAKIIGPLVGVDDAVNNGAFMRRLKGLAAAGWLEPARGGGYRVNIDRGQKRAGTPQPT